MSKEFSRRNFLKGAAAGAVGAAGMGILTACSGSASATAGVNPAWVPEQWDYEADVVICGYGAAGGMGAKTAVENGNSVLILEKAPEEYAGGASTCFGGFLSVADPETLMYSANDYLTQATAEKLSNEMQKSIDWCLSSGLKAQQLMPTSHRADGTGRGFYAFLKAALNACGANVLYETAARNLIFDPSTKTVYGVRAEDKNGGSIYVKANKGVLLATGNMCGNRDLVDRYFLPKEVDTPHVGSPYDTGDGFIMGMEIGASVKSLNFRSMEITDFSLTKASKEMGTGIMFLAAGPNKDARIYINAKGQRITNENIIWGHYKGNCPWLDFPHDSGYGFEGWVNLPFYVIFDSKLFDNEAIIPADMNIYWAQAMNVYKWSADNKAELAKGWFAKGNTLDELVENLATQSGHEKVDPEGLKAAIAEYNMASAGGKDEKFGRNGLLALDTAPYYAAELSTSIMYTMGGLRIGENAETLDWNDQPIPGLYHAGDVGQVCEIVSQGVVGAMAYGAIGVRAICAAEKRDIPGPVKTVIPAPTAEQQNSAAGGAPITYTVPNAGGTDAIAGASQTDAVAGASQKK